MTRAIAVAATIMSLAGAAPALGVSPGTQGQPNQSCQAESTGPPGIFSMDNGFANIAVNVYAGTPGTPSYLNGNPTAVSQYDVACFEVSNSH